MPNKKYIIIPLLFFWICSVSQTKNQETPNGQNIFYYPNGQISGQGEMKDGNPVGIWKAYYVNGTLKSVGKRKNNALDSVWVFYNDDGNIREKINYLNGKKNGYYYSFEYFLNKDSVKVGYLKSRELYLDNLKNGISEYYFKDGVINQKINYQKGKKHGTARIYNQEGILTTIIDYRYGQETDRERINRYKNDTIKIGVWKEFYPNGKVKFEYNYKMGLLHGLVKEYDLSGDLISTKRYLQGELKDTAFTIESEIDIVEEFFNLRDSTGKLIKKKSGGFVEGKPIGVHREYDSLGRVVGSKLFDKQGNLIGKGIMNTEGDRVGYWTFYYSSGTKKSEGKYLKNRRIDNWIYYYPSGSVEQRGVFKNGLPNGMWLYYFEDGTLKREETYKNGKEQGKCTEYDNYGNIIAQGDYLDGEKQGKWFYNFYYHTENGNYNSGFKTGEWTYTYKSGAKYFQGSFLEGYEDGQHIYYHKNGKVKEIRYYLFGRKIKNWEYYDYYGTLLKIITFDNDKLTKIDGISVLTD